MNSDYLYGEQKFKIALLSIVFIALTAFIIFFDIKTIYDVVKEYNKYAEMMNAIPAAYLSFIKPTEPNVLFWIHSLANILWKLLISIFVFIAIVRKYIKHSKETIA